MKPLIITNNLKVYDEFSAKVEIVYGEDLSQEEILKMARDRIHLGAKLVIHPMMGRIKPHETPFKSVFLEIPDEREISDGSFTPEQIKEAYLARGYSVVAFTDHNILLSHQELTDRRFLALNG
ncbi:MAG: GrdX family protein, partial [Firmicutes bacterium]|nr:GrdX family protein [Bacillota bacterium]